MPKHLIPVLSFGAAAVILLMLNFTTPAEIGPFGVLVFFTMVYVLMLGLGILLVKFFVKLLRRTMRRKDYLYGAVVAFCANHADVDAVAGDGELADSGASGGVYGVGMFLGE